MDEVEMHRCRGRLSLSLSLLSLSLSLSLSSLSPKSKYFTQNKNQRHLREKNQEKGARVL